MDAVLRLLMGPWTTYILWVLRSNGPTRFGELKRKVSGISAKVLTERLRTLEAAEIIERHYEPTVPPRVTYKMAERGNQLAPVLDQLSGLGQRWLDEDAARQSQRDMKVPAADRDAATKSTIATA
ncbi:MAG: helix-turn-helix transcriptional regulator [Alphaproteobacteria bacterium]|nr:helix-turn-helix transcriptional regulator [Alphaproteobacteria bacterium]